jgi:hypothetical protein
MKGHNCSLLLVGLHQQGRKMASRPLLLCFLTSTLLLLAVARPTPQEAATTVSADPNNAGFPLFEAERVQVNDEILRAVRELDSPSGLAKQFAFDDDSEDVSQQSGSCKALPGDPSWPSDDSWNFFNSLLGGALVPVVPLASPCYQTSVYDNYNAKRCEVVRSNFATPEIQCVFAFRH